MTTTQDTLIERAAELELLNGAVVRLRERGDGSVVVLEAHAGLGKTALLDAVEAAAAGCQVRRAMPGPLERHFAFGVIRALLEHPVREAAPAQRAHLLDGVAAHAGALLLEGTVPGGDAAMLLAHSVFWLCAALAEDRPLVLIVDDAQWADRPSLEVLAYVARRIGDAPLLVCVAARADDPEAPSDLLGLLGGTRGASVLRPRPLTPDGAEQLIRRHVPGVGPHACAECHRASDGNPWLLTALSRQLAEHGDAALRAPVAGAPPVSDVARAVVRERLAGLGPVATAVVLALAVLGDSPQPHVLAQLAAVGQGELPGALETLTAAGLLSGARPRFAHGLIAHAVIAEMPAAARDTLRRRAIEVLEADGAPAYVCAGHLLDCAPRGDAAVTSMLRLAAEEAAERGAPHAAAAFLERALLERAVGDERGEMLARMATLSFAAGLPAAREYLREALGEQLSRDGRIEVLTRLAALQVVDIGDHGLAHLFEEALAEERDQMTRHAVEAAALDALMMQADRYEERARRAAALDPEQIDDAVIAHTARAHRAWLATERGTPDVDACAALAADALADGRLLPEAFHRGAYHLCVRALTLCDRGAAATAAIDALGEQAMTQGSLRMRAAATWYAAELALREGRTADAENDARLALDLMPGANMITGGAVEVLVCALAERAAFEEADHVLRDRGFAGRLGERMYWEIGIRHARARRHLLEGDFGRALDEALDAGRLRLAQGRTNPTWTPWRSTAALALAHLGRADEATGLAEEELQLARAFGAPVPILRAEHAVAVAETDDHAAVARCQAALGLAANATALLEDARLRLELGRRLLRLGDRLGAREALRPALAVADSAGAAHLAAEARRSLVATGLRPRHAATQGVAALTPRQRQVCELAAAGKGNRAIAQELFLSIKTVETHLAAGFRKLGVTAREDLDRALELSGAGGSA